MAEQRLGDADMRRIADGKLGGNNLAEQMRVDIAVELALGDRADPFADLLAGQRLAPMTDPERVCSGRRRGTPGQLRPIIIKISVDPWGEVIRKGHLDRPLVLGALGSECGPPYRPAAL